MNGLKHVPLTEELTLIVEYKTHYQPDLEREAHFAGIWPKSGGPVAKKWIPADTPAEAIRLGQHWARQWLETG